MAWLGSWAKRVKITVDSADVTAALTNFPFLVFLSTASGRFGDDVSFIFDELASDENRKKIAVTTSDGITQCYVEIEKWDDTNEQAWLWVKGDLSNLADTDFYLYFDATKPDNDTYVGDPGSAAAKNVWDTNFKGVWHLSDAPIQSSMIEKNTTTYDCFGLVLKTGANTFMYFTRMGSSHVLDKGKVVKITYNPVTHAWGNYSDVYEDSNDNYDSRNIAGGIIGTHIFLFFVRHNIITETFVDIGYIKSTDLTGTSWGSYTTISVSPLTKFSPHGAIVNVNGTYYQPFYGRVGTTYYIKLFESTDSGDSWTVGPTVYSGTTYYAEPACGYIGNDKLILLARNVDGGKLRQFQSSDGGDTWSNTGDTNLGLATGQSACSIRVKDDRILAVFGVCDGAPDAYVHLSDSPHADVWDNPTNWTPAINLGAMSTPMWVGYCSIAHWKDNIWVCVYPYGVSLSDIDTRVRQYKRVELPDSTTNGNHGISVNMTPADQVVGQIDGSLDFDGVDDRVSVDDAPELSAIGDFSTEAWIKIASLGGHEGIVSKDDGAGGHREWLLCGHSDDDLLCLHCFSADSTNYLLARGTVDIADGAWHYVVATWDGVNDEGHIKLYVDGDVDVLTKDFKYLTGCVPHDTATPVEIGRYYASNTYCWSGIIDEVRISDGVRNAAWIEATYEAGRDDLLDFGSEETAAAPPKGGSMAAKMVGAGLI